MRRILPLLIVLSLACSQHAFRDSDHERFDQPDEAAAFYAMRHAADPGVDPQERYATARAAMQQMDRYSSSDARVIDRGGRARIESTTYTTSVTAWQFLGPGNIGGRTRALVFDPTNDQILYAGGVSGGIWKSIDGGESWKPAGDTLVNLDISSIVVDPKDPQTIFAGTGEGYFREDVRGTALPLRGDGIFVSHDAGATWQQLPVTANNDDFRWVNDLVMSPTNSNRLYAGTRAGVFRTTDGGATWTRVLPTTVKGGCLDLVIRPDLKDDMVFAACGVFEQGTVYRNVAAQNDGSQWVSVLSPNGMSRTSLALAPSNPSIIYALAASNLPGTGNSTQNTTQNLLAVYRSSQSGDAGTWTAQVTANDPDKVNRVLLTNPIPAVQPQCLLTGGVGQWTPMGWHCNVIAVDPTNPDRLWAAGVDVFRSDDGGKTWGAASYWWTDKTTPGFLHADQHVLLFHPKWNGSSNQTLFAGNDGGIYRSDNALDTVVKGADGVCKVASKIVWRSLNRDYGVTQFYDGTVFPDGKRFMGGAQDNGTLIGDVTGGANQWVMAWGGDGGYVAVDRTNPQVIYGQSQNANIVKSVDGGTLFKSVTPPGAGTTNFLFIAPLAIDPNNPARLWAGGAQMWRTDNSAESWTAASQETDGLVSAIAVAPGHSDRVVAGTSNGAIIRSDVATGASGNMQWASTKPRTGYVSSITIDPNDMNVVYATYARFGGTHIWRSTDGGATFSPLDNNLPDFPVHSLVIDRTTTATRLYIGTDLGIFVSVDNGATWMIESGFVPVVTERLLIAQGSHGPALYAFTHGRGAWRAELTPPAPRRRAAGH